MVYTIIVPYTRAQNGAISLVQEIRFASKLDTAHFIKPIRFDPFF